MGTEPLLHQFAIELEVLTIMIFWPNIKTS